MAPVDDVGAESIAHFLPFNTFMRVLIVRSSVLVSYLAVGSSDSSTEAVSYFSKD